MTLVTSNLLDARSLNVSLILCQFSSVRRYAFGVLWVFSAVILSLRAKNVDLYGTQARITVLGQENRPWLAGSCQTKIDHYLTNIS